MFQFCSDRTGALRAACSLLLLLRAAAPCAAATLTEMVRDIRPVDSSVPTDLVAVSNRVFFTAYETVHGRELWVSDGTSNGTCLAKDIAPGVSLNTSIQQLTPCGSFLMANANDGVHGWELWKSDGTTNGTYLMRDIYPGYSGGDILEMVAFSNLVVLCGNDGAHGRELWRSDGTATGTYMLADILVGASGSTPKNFLVCDDGVLFSASSEYNMGNLWKTDGTPGGTKAVFRAPGLQDWVERPLGRIASRTLFTMYRIGEGVELWRTEGGAEGGARVMDIYPGDGSSFPSNPQVYSNALLFAANDGVHGTELWKSDGTEAGTLMLKDISPGNGSASPASLLEFKGYVYFTAHDPTNLVELWRTDGTASGTVRITAIESMIYTELVRMGDNLYFQAGTLSSGRELWVSDGTPQGTHLVKDLNPGNPSSLARDFAACGNQLFFHANDGKHGGELWHVVEADPGLKVGAVGLPGAGVHLQLTNMTPLFPYRIERSPDLLTPAWTAAATFRAGVCVTNWTEPSARERCFYRAVAVGD